MRTVALLGGMTYDATALYYKVINDRIRQRFGGRYSAPLILHSFNFHPVLEDMNNGEWESIITRFTQAVQHMKAAGAEGFAICANYPHKVAREVEESTNLKILHIADMTAHAIQKSAITKVGLLGTRMVMEEDYIKGRIAENFGIEVIVPKDQNIRNMVHEELMSNLPSGKVSAQCQQMLISAAQELVDQGANGLILGSTDLAFALKPEHVHVELFDTNKIHAEGVADWIMGSDY